MLELQVAEDVVFAFYQPPDAGPNVGGYVARVWPGGAFLGVGFEQLRSLGTGRHQRVLDEEADDGDGTEPVYDSEWRREFERFKFYLFMYGVGACVPLDVLARARDVIRLESEDKAVPEPGG